MLDLVKETDVFWMHVAFAEDDTKPSRINFVSLCADTYLVYVPSPSGNQVQNEEILKYPTP